MSRLLSYMSRRSSVDFVGKHLRVVPGHRRFRLPRNMLSGRTPGPSDPRRCRVWPAREFASSTVPESPPRSGPRRERPVRLRRHVAEAALRFCSSQSRQLVLGARSPLSDPGGILTCVDSQDQPLYVKTLVEGHATFVDPNTGVVAWRDPHVRVPHQHAYCGRTSTQAATASVGREVCQLPASGN